MHLLTRLAVLLLTGLLHLIGAVPANGVAPEALIPDIHSFLASQSLSHASTPNLHPLAPRSMIECFRQENDHTLTNIVASDCFNAANLIQCDDKLLEVPMIFSRDPTKGYKLPEKITSGSCNIVIDILSGDDVEDTESLAVIKAFAVQMTITCVVDQPHYKLGGRVQLGQSGSLWLFVAGDVIKPSRLKPRPIYKPMIGAGPGRCGWSAPAAGGSGDSL